MRLWCHARYSFVHSALQQQHQYCEPCGRLLAYLCNYSLSGLSVTTACGISRGCEKQLNCKAAIPIQHIWGTWRSPKTGELVDCPVFMTASNWTTIQWQRPCNGPEVIWFTIASCGHSDIIIIEEPGIRHGAERNKRPGRHWWRRDMTQRWCPTVHRHAPTKHNGNITISSFCTISTYWPFWQHSATTHIFTYCYLHRLQVKLHHRFIILITDALQHHYSHTHKLSQSHRRLVAMSSFDTISLF